MNIPNLKRALVDKANQLRREKISKDQIAIERNAEILDEIQRTSDREIVMAFMTRDWLTAALVSEALERIDTGEYGTCLECDDAISERRLNAIPWAKYCIGCQEAVDARSEKGYLAEAA